LLCFSMAWTIDPRYFASRSLAAQPSSQPTIWITIRRRTSGILFPVSNALKPVRVSALTTGKLILHTSTGIINPVDSTSGVTEFERQRGILGLPGRRIRLRSDATGAPTQRPEWWGGASRPKETSHSGGKAVNRGSARAAPSHQNKANLPYDAAAALVRQLRGPHLSTWP
jgi:hypothetical protein